MMAEVVMMITEDNELLDYLSKFYGISIDELTQKYTMSQLEDAYNEIEHKTKYQKHLDNKKEFPTKYVIKEFSPL
jgi:hypothetical protein